MTSIDGKEEHDAFNSRIEEKQPLNIQKGTKTNPSGQQKQFQHEKEATSSEQGQGKNTSQKPFSQGYRIPNIQQDSMENLFQIARAMMEMQMREEAIFKYQKEFLRFWMKFKPCI
ncbi:hypothetical protein O181_072443 [Austropuccinia psidii MF-1]|uniref:Uncharacterized protein n=1 Tax=Austropuccinia psidii MF-1 TaxID=1389203 RepID=A0A9Q3F305_9BASI|nr:hypothetical protein [Austropuccinia psidii MF-1]